MLALFVSMFLFTMDAPAKSGGTWTGTLLDQHCSAKHAANPSDHETSCVMKCAKNGKGLGMAVDGKWYSFDSKGEKMGWKILKKSKATSNLQVTVNGTLKGDKIIVKKMTEKA